MYIMCLPPAECGLYHSKSFPLGFIMKEDIDMFERLELMINKEKLNKLQNINVLIVGIGGVGGYALEALVRTGIKNITIVDNDIIDISNINRQIISLHSNIGQEKVKIASLRAKDINPDINIISLNKFVLNDKIDELFNTKYDYIIDACDTITTKMLLIKKAQDLNIKIISCMGTGNRLNPQELTITKLNKTNNDPLAKNLRRILKENNINTNINVVWSRELPIKTNNRTPGSCVIVPMSAGNLLASYIINDFLTNNNI